MEEVITYLVNERNELGEVSLTLYPYIDYKGYTDTLDALGRFLPIHGNLYEYNVNMKNMQSTIRIIFLVKFQNIPLLMNLTICMK